jgi:CRISPR-associated exonuclease Cas4
VEDELLPVTALSHYFFCKRDPYYLYVVHTPEPITETMEAGKQVHDRDTFQAFLRKLEPKHFFRRPVLRSAELGISGVPDYVFITKHSEILPAEVKYSPQAGRSSLKSISQLVGYALILEYNYVYRGNELLESGYAKTKTIIKRCAVYNAYSKKVDIIEITQELKNRVLKALEELKSMIQSGEFPSVRQPWSKCANCWYRRYCYP